MSLLQFILIISSFVILLFAIDSYQRKKVNFLHFIVFVWWTIIILLFSFNLDLLNKFWRFFWLTRWADLLVYISIIMLWYFYFEILNKLTKDSYNFSRFITNDSFRDLDLEEIKSKISSFNFDEKNQFLFLIRAYNESQVIWPVIDEILNYWFNKILLINDWSTDSTRQIILDKQIAYKDKLIILLNHLINRGGWAANKTWFDFIKRHGDLLNIKRLVTYDADGQMNISDMDSFISTINSWDFDILLWSRFISWGKALNIPFFRRVILWGAKVITFVFGGVWISDPHNGYRVISFESMKKMDIKSDGMTYASEIIEEIKNNKLKYTQVPVNIKYTEYSLSKGQKNSNAIRILLEIIYKKFFFK